MIIVNILNFIFRYLFEIISLWFIVWLYFNKKQRRKLISQAKNALKSIFETTRVAAQPKLGTTESIDSTVLVNDFSEGIQVELKETFKQEQSRDFSNILEEKQYLLLNQYYSQGLAQSSISFGFSLVSAFLGFMVIALSIIRIDANSQGSNQTAAFVSLIAGTIIDVVSALFFIETNKARKLMVDFSDKLRADQKLNESLSLIEKIPDKTIQSKVKAIMTLNFAGINIDDKEFLKELLNSSTESIANFESLSNQQANSTTKTES
jgi:hypothetical protein